MLNIEEINNTIQELENGDTTFQNCKNLAALYIVREHIENVSETAENGSEDNVQIELDDVLPQYKIYIAAKQRYQRREISETNVIEALQGVCREIQEFIQALYSSTDTAEERLQLKEMAANIYEDFK